MRTVAEIDDALRWYAENLPGCPDHATHEGVCWYVDKLLDERNESADQVEAP